MEIFVLVAPAVGEISLLFMFSIRRFSRINVLRYIPEGAKKGCERFYVAVQQLKRVEHCSSIFS